jgi:hypothetical protein
MRPAWESPPYHVTSLPLGGVSTLTNVGTNPVVIGVAKADLTNVTKAELTVHVNKVGTGTQSWQLWNETDGVEVVRIQDAAGTGAKTLTTGEVNIAAHNWSGMKVLFLRAFSSVGADDPIYRGGCACLS